MTTIRDVAEYAQVSVGTVSNVLNGASLVKEETRLRVLAAIEALNFHPKAAARSLTTRRTNTIGMVRTELRPRDHKIESDPFILQLIEGVTTAALDSSGTGLTFWATPVGKAEMSLYKELVIGHQVDGLILFATRENDPRIQFLRQWDFPFVVFGRTDDNTDVPWIDVDGAYGMHLAVDHLAGLGHQRIGYIAPPSEQMLSRHRWEGFISAMAAHKLTIDPELVREGDFSEQSGQLCTHYFLDLAQPPSAIICNNDRMAFGAMRALQARGLMPGREVSVIGFDDIPLASYSHPPLTTLHQPIFDIGRQLFSLLLRIIEEQPVDGLQSQLIQPTLRVRQSTAPPA